MYYYGQQTRSNSQNRLTMIAHQMNHYAANRTRRDGRFGFGQMFSSPSIGLGRAAFQQISRIGNIFR